MIRTQCPHCQAPLSFREEAAGLPAVCKSCRQALQVPAPPVLAEVAEGRGPRRRPLSPGAVINWCVLIAVVSAMVLLGIAALDPGADGGLPGLVRQARNLVFYCLLAVAAYAIARAVNGLLGR